MKAAHHRKVDNELAGKYKNPYEIKSLRTGWSAEDIILAARLKLFETYNDKKKMRKKCIHGSKENILAKILVKK